MIEIQLMYRDFDQLILLDFLFRRGGDLKFDLPGYLFSGFLFFGVSFSKYSFSKTNCGFNFKVLGLKIFNNFFF